MAKLEILIDFYAPELRSQLAQVLKIRDSLGEPIKFALLGDAPKDGSHRQQLTSALIESSFAILVVSTELGKGAAEVARRHLRFEDRPASPAVLPTGNAVDTRTRS